MKTLLPYHTSVIPPLHMYFVNFEELDHHLKHDLSNIFWLEFRFFRPVLL
jgi:hypothetical protein